VADIKGRSMIENRQTILLVDDTETNIDILLELLGDEYDVMVALSGQGALEIVKDDKIDLILLDIMMPEMDGYEVCQILKNDNSTKDIPVIFITAKTDEDSIEKAYEVGGVDYVTKPFKPRELIVRVKTHIKLKNLIENLEYMASYDEMTGIYNRRKFFSLATKKFEESKKDLYAVMMDIDKFKNINDTYGHPIGDKVIKLVTKIIGESVQSDSIFGRIGGEEFAIICSASSKEYVINSMESIRDNISKASVLTDNNEVVKFTISNGISKVTDETSSVDNFLKEADIALYEAKGSGRNKVIFR